MEWQFYTPKSTEWVVSVGAVDCAFAIPAVAAFPAIFETASTASDAGNDSGRTDSSQETDLLVQFSNPSNPPSPFVRL